MCTCMHIDLHRRRKVLNIGEGGGGGARFRILDIGGAGQTFR